MRNYDKEKLVKLWNKGKTAKEIAKELGIADTTVSKYASRHRDLCSKRS